MSQVAVSIIMPVYNDEENIEEALCSILDQTLKNIEVICINDGSTDDSVNIIEKFKDDFFNLKIIHQENKGSGIARNNGMDVAEGEYIAFLDADDIFVDNHALKKMYDVAKLLNAEMVSANLKGITVDGDLVNNDNLTRFSEQKIIMPEDYEIPYSFYKNIFKRTFLNENNLRFPDLKRGQDPVFLAEILTSISNIPVVPIDLYGFRYAAIGGLNKINTVEKKYDYVQHFKDTFDVLKKGNFFKMAEIYEEKLEYYIKSSTNCYDRDIYNAVNTIFKEDMVILNKIKPLFSINDKKISVVIPVYNAENYLEESINSILSQTLNEIELICVNDGSTDNSLDILKKFSKDDSRIKIIDKENGGCGSARNVALDNAKGEYIYFFDPDDYVLPDAFEKLYNNAILNNSDLVMFKIARFRDGEPINYSIPGFDFENVFKDVDFDNFTFNYNDIKNYVLNSSFAPWSKLYKKEFLDRFVDFRFDLGVAFDDVPFHVKSVLRAKKISFVPEFFYHYRLSNPNSVNNTKSNQIDIFKICDIVEHFLKNENFFNEFKKEFYEFKIKQIMNYIISCNYEDYYILSKKEFLDMDLKNVNISKQLLQDYFLVINSDSYDDLRVKKGVSPLNNTAQISPKISVIIPVFNTEKYMSKCLDSVTSQKLKEIEIICVDDGSTDDSWNVLREYAKKDNRIKIFFKDNGGAGSARNMGLDNARGEFINFIDSDDWINENTLKICYDKSMKDNLDILMFLLINYDDLSEEFYESEYYNISCIPSKFDNIIFNYKDVGDSIFDIAVSPCNKLIKKSFIDNLNFRFHEGVMFEDNPFFFKLFLNAEKVSIIREYFYYRRRRKGSVMTSTGEKLKDNIVMTSEVIKIFREKNLLTEYKSRLTNYKLLNMRFYYNKLDSEHKQSFFEEMKKDLESIDSQDELSVLFRENLNYDVLKFFKYALCSKNNSEFDSMIDEFNEYMRLKKSFEKLEYNDLKNQIKNHENEIKILKDNALKLNNQINNYELEINDLKNKELLLKNQIKNHIYIEDILKNSLDVIKKSNNELNLKVFKQQEDINYLKLKNKYLMDSFNNKNMDSKINIKFRRK